MEQKIRELKRRVANLKAIYDKNKAKIPPTTIIRQPAENRNDVKDVKSKNYGISPIDVEKDYYLVNGLKHYSILKEYNDQKKYPVDLIDMIKKIMTRFSPITSTNGRIRPQNFLAFGFNPFATLV